MTDDDLARIEAKAKAQIEMRHWNGTNPRDVLALVARVRELEALIAEAIPVIRQSNDISEEFARGFPQVIERLKQCDWNVLLKPGKRIDEVTDTNNFLAQIEARLAAATPGPWEAERIPHPGRSDRCQIMPNDEYAITAPGKYSNWIGQPEADAAFIAAAPDDIRWLINRVRALEDDVEKYRTRAYLLYVAAKNAGAVALSDPTED